MRRRVLLPALWCGIVAAAAAALLAYAPLSTSLPCLAAWAGAFLSSLSPLLAVSLPIASAVVVSPAPLSLSAVALHLAGLAHVLLLAASATPRSLARSPVLAPLLALGRVLPAVAAEIAVLPLLAGLILWHRVLSALGSTWDAATGSLDPAPSHACAPSSAVVLVHGLATNDSQFFLGRAILAPSVRVSSLSYHTDDGGWGIFPAPQDNVELYAARLVVHVRSLVAQAGIDTVVLVGHSLGGLVALRAAHILHDSPDTPVRVAGVLTLSSPLAGSKILAFLLDYAPWALWALTGLTPDHPLVADLLPGSSALQRIYDNSKQDHPPMGVLSASLDTIVTADSASRLASLAQQTVELDHVHHYAMIASVSLWRFVERVALGWLS